MPYFALIIMFYHVNIACYQLSYSSSQDLTFLQENFHEIEFIYINLVFFFSRIHKESRDVFLEQRGATPKEKVSPKKEAIVQNLNDLFRTHFSPIHGAIDG